MSQFVGYETSRNLGKPINLYKFQYGPETDQFFAYTDADKEVVRDGVTYSPIPIDRDEITSSPTLDKAALNITVPRDSEIAMRFLDGTPSYPVSLIIFETHIDVDDVAASWAGRVLSSLRNASTAELTCEPRSTQMRRPGLRRNWQFGCPHVLYSQGVFGEFLCEANKAAATFTHTVLSVDGTNLVTLSGALSGGINHYRQGMMQWTGADGEFHIATILDLTVSGGNTQIYTSADVSSIAEIDSNSGFVDVQIIKGCGHNVTDCATIHDNLKNYGGQDMIPLKQPLGGTRNFFGG